MRYTANYRETGKFLRSQQLRKPLTLAAAKILARGRVLVEKDSGETAASGRLVHLTQAGAKRDRIGVSVVFGGAAVAKQFGNKRTRPTRFLTRATLE